MADTIAHELRFSVLNKYYDWQSEDLLAAQVNDSEPEKILPSVKAAVAKYSEQASLTTWSRFVINNIGYVVFFKTIILWNDLTREKRVLNRMPCIGMKVDSGPPSYSGVSSAFGSARYYRM